MKILVAALLGGFVAAQAHADPRADVQQALGQVLDAGGFRAHAQGHWLGPGVPALAGDVDVVFPDRIHARTDALEFIAMGDSAWIRALGVWTSAERSLLPVTGFDPPAMRRAIASIREARIEGGSKTAQCAAHIYRFRASGKLPGASADGDVRAWLCDGSHRLARLEATDTRSGERAIVDFDWSHRASVQAPSD